MTHSDLWESSMADVVRLARWLGLEHGRRESELPADYRRRVILAVALCTRRRMLVDPDLVAAQRDVVEQAYTVAPNWCKVE